MIIFDPHSSHLDSVAQEPALDASRLQPDWIRNRFLHAPDWQPEQTDEHRLSLRHNQFKNASVLIALVQREQGLQVLLTRRNAQLSQHAGQISFPGGLAEPEDGDAIQTALRESQEEIGLAPDRVEILGQLPHYYTVTGYRVTPVVGCVSVPGQFKADAAEVAEIFEVPLEFLMNGSAHQIRSVELKAPDSETGRRTFYAMPYHDHFIWGATAGMLRNLFHFLRA